MTTYSKATADGLSGELGVNGVPSISYGSLIYFYTSGSERMRIDSSGNTLAMSATGLLGYGPGSGGTVTQATSKATTVTLNKPCGQITTAADALGAGGNVSFVLTNSLITPASLLLITADNNANYQILPTYTTNGSVGIRIVNISGGSLSQAIGINFAVIKGAVA